MIGFGVVVLTDVFWPVHKEVVVIVTSANGALIFDKERMNAPLFLLSVKVRPCHLGKEVQTQGVNVLKMKSNNV